MYTPRISYVEFFYSLEEKIRIFTCVEIKQKLILIFLFLFIKNIILINNEKEKIISLELCTL